MPRVVTELSLLTMTALLLVVSQLLLKRGLGGQALSITSVGQLGALIWQVLTTPALFAGYALSLLTSLLWLVLLSRMELSYASPLLSGIYYILLVITSLLFLHEALTPWRLGGMLFVLIGSILITRGQP